MWLENYLLLIIMIIIYYYHSLLLFIIELCSCLQNGNSVLCFAILPTELQYTLNIYGSPSHKHSQQIAGCGRDDGRFNKGWFYESKNWLRKRSSVDPFNLVSGTFLS